MKRTLQASAEEFLSHSRIAVAGVSRGRPDAANHIYRKLRTNAFEVYAVNPNADTVEGDACYRSLAAIPVRPDGVVIATHPEQAAAVVAECAALGIERVWFHRSVGEGSVASDAVALAHAHGMKVIEGACPMMFLRPVDPAHRCMCAVLGWMGRLPDGYVRA